MLKDQSSTYSIPIIVDSGRTKFRVGYGADKIPKSINPTVYWKDTLNQYKFTQVPVNQSVPVFSLFSRRTNPEQEFTVEDHCSSFVADHDILLDFINQLTIKDLCLEQDLEKFPFVFSREDRNEKIDFPELKIDKEGDKDKEKPVS